MEKFGRDDVESLPGGIEQAMKIGVVIPSLNECDSLRLLLNSIEAQMNDKDEILISIVDGLSTDGTKEMVEEFSARNSNFHFLQNEKKITPVALNIGTKFCLDNNVEVVQYLGAHAIIDKNYFKNLMQLLSERKDVAVFSPSMDFTKAKTKFELLNQHFTISRFGRNWKKIYEMKEPIYGFTTGIMAVRKEVIEKVGFYNEEMVRNQDNEFAHRIETFGLKILTHPNLKYYYEVRNNLHSFVKQMFDSGVYVGFNLLKHGRKHKIPALFWFINLWLVMLLVLNKYLFSQNYLNQITEIFAFLNISYLLFLLIEMIKMNTSISKTGFNFFWLVIFIHAVYALGTFKGVVKRLIKILRWTS